MGIHIDEKEILRVLSWKKENNASLRDCEAKFRYSRNTVNKWVNSYSVEELASKYKGEIEYSTGEVNIKTKIPVEVEKAIDSAAIGLSNVTKKTAHILGLWLDGINEKIATHKTLRPAEINLMVKLLGVTSPYVVAPKGAGDGPSKPVSSFESIKKDMEEKAAKGIIPYPPQPINQKPN